MNATDERIAAITAEKIAVMQAYADGKKIEYRNRPRTPNGEGSWQETIAPSWQWSDREYRVKKEPRVMYLNIYCSDYAIAYDSKEEADLDERGRFRTMCREKAVKFIEVLEGEDK